MKHLLIIALTLFIMACKPDSPPQPPKWSYKPINIVEDKTEQGTLVYLQVKERGT